MSSELLQLPASAFPFYFRLDRALTIHSYGVTLPRTIPNIAIGQNWNEVLSQVRPSTAIEQVWSTPSEIQSRTLYVFRALSNGLLFRGQLLFDELTDTLLFLGSPWLNDPAQLPKFGLSLNDFAIHDASTDLLQVIQDLKNSLHESRDIAAQFQKQRALLHNILKTAPDAIITTDANGNIESFNPAAQIMFGWEEYEVHGQNVSLLTAADYTAAHQAHMETAAERVFTPNFNRRREVMARRRNLEEFPAEISLSSLQVSTELHFTGIIRDISERKAQQIALAAARERELQLGHDIQQSLLFGTPLSLRGLEISAFTQPSQGIDGDFFDFFTLGDQCLDVFTGDVMGKGVVAAMIGAALKSQYNRTMAELLGASLGQPPDTDQIINRVHTRVTPELQRLESFVTLIFARVELALNRIRYINAGHPEGLIFTKDGNILSLTGDYLPLGVDDKEQYSAIDVPFYPGDFLLLFSDGVSEARNAHFELLGVEPVIQLVQQLKAAHIPPAIILQRLRQLVDAHESSHRRSDDFTAIGIYRHDTTLPSSREFMRKMSVLSPLRHWLREQIKLSEPQLAAIELAAVEVATNIIRHVAITLADTPFVVHIIEHTDQLLIDFYYVGQAFDPTLVPMPDFSGGREGGFGLYIIRQCVDDVHYSTPAEDVNRIRLHIKKENTAAVSIPNIYK
ncbi:SpoIIE family protein phosphatase [Chitinibacter bivalviorum]|uniref:guanylate cyclase n=1 Tax=Chitinibacter bivalviorum TaxID=2739434 RepID=A0A7H9BHN2_9NEIS|nr:SpoIIE family protein phosphatase [Chitinibacter bivalviorum]QLG87776.1 SpoIIE family protein phosphatase [Chitinibacter bivalviorum]